MLRLQGHRCAEWRVPPSRCFLNSNVGDRTAWQGRQRSCRCIIAAAAAQDAGPVVAIPQSREEAVKAAVAAVLSQIKTLTGAKKSRKGFAAPGSSTSGTSNRLSVELPLADSSPAEAAKLAQDLLALLPAAALKEAAVVFASEAAAAAAGGAVRRGRVLSLKAACQGQQLMGPIVLVEPATADVALVEQLLTEVWAGGPWVLLINPSWQSSSIPAEYSALVESFQAAYCFMPIATKGLMRVEGAVLCDVSSSSSSSMWRVLVQQGGSEQFVQVGQMKTRPSQSDLELVLLNAKAANSPLTSLVKGVKGMLDRGKKS